MTQNNNFLTVTVDVDITATSSKAGDKFSTDVKSAYIVPKTENDKKKLIDLGLRLYTAKSKADGEEEEFFILKFTKKTYLYIKDEEGEFQAQDFTEFTELGSPNFSFTDVSIAIMPLYSEVYNVDFFRLQAILEKPESKFQVFMPRNPFE